MKELPGSYIHDNGSPMVKSGETWPLAERCMRRWRSKALGTRVIVVQATEAILLRTVRRFGRFACQSFCYFLILQLIDRAVYISLQSRCFHCHCWCWCSKLQPIAARVSRGEKLGPPLSPLQPATNFLFFTLHPFAIRRCTMVSRMRAAPDTAISRSSHTAVVAEIFIGRMFGGLANRFGQHPVADTLLSHLMCSPERHRTVLSISHQNRLCFLQLANIAFLS